MYCVVFEKAPNNWSAYVPDLPGCISTGKTRDEVERMIKEAIEFHLEGMAEDNEAISEPTSYAKEIEVSPPQKPARKAG
jgi:predicted RNase H-like HicB family nuclease